MISRCNCTNSRDGNQAAARFQDRKHGFGMRVFNRMPATKLSPLKARCTVCGFDKVIEGDKP